MQQQARPQMQPPAYMPPQAMQNQQRVSNHPALTPSLNYPMQTPQPLYGSLHDDITRGSAGYRRPVTAPDDLSDPDAPIATSRAVPTKPVESQNLNRNAMPALAGG